MRNLRFKGYLHFNVFNLPKPDGVDYNEILFLRKDVELHFMNNSTKLRFDRISLTRRSYFLEA
ncbi:hypothetical protein LCDVSa040R [Lymphocystis disease virus 3]|uniref:Uncharacterized protein n=1 Tax=Lymphocystis disease virus 3 TaxID=2560566 RepID=A0A1B2RVU3_9VIRU|nr:hypothetical protein BZK12_gp040 [Lymphocystis disease virus Sa]AOC55124.1 hypothetical protein LCDVSa040R [Lymphocystis disease virus 3]